MIHRLARFLGFAGITLATYAVSLQVVDPTVERLFYTFAGLTVFYGFFRLLLQELVERKMNEDKKKAKSLL